MDRCANIVAVLSQSHSTWRHLERLWGGQTIGVTPLKSVGFFPGRRRASEVIQSKAWDVSTGPGVSGLSEHQLAGAAGEGQRRMRLVEERP